MSHIHPRFAVATALTAALLLTTSCSKQKQCKYHPAEVQRILISSDIGGTDPDDNQSMLHLLMYSNEFDIEGLVSSPSYGTGSKEEILRMIDLYQWDLPKLRAGYYKYLTEQGFIKADTAAFATGCFDFQKVREGYVMRDFMEPDSLRAITKQGRQDESPIQGYDQPTEGSDWIVQCAKKEDARPLYVLVWGCLEDVAQALHDAPEIAPKLRVYWIGGPNKKWGTNAYTYIINHFPDLWFIENNASYRGFIASSKDSSEYQAGFWQAHMKGHGAIGDTFGNYYAGVPKMGDTPSLLYMMGGRMLNTTRVYKVMDPADPTMENWGGQYEPMTVSPKYIITGPLAETDTVPCYAIMEWQLDGPVVNIPYDSVAFTLTVANQTWRGHYMGNGHYCVRYAPKAPATLPYVISSPIAEFPCHEGVFVAGDHWPAVDEYQTTSPTITAHHAKLGSHWWTDMSDTSLQSGVSDYEDGSKQDASWQGASTVAKWREDVMKDWALRFSWL